MMYRRRQSKHLLLYALALHLTLTTATCLAGRYGLLPKIFNGNGIGIAFAIDGLNYVEESKSLVSILTHDGVRAWLSSPYQAHVKLYSLCFALFHPLFGFTTLSVEPLNLAYYLAILVLVFKIGKEVFGERTGVLAAGMIALWPSFLLHTTQLLRDPLFIVAMLLLILICLRQVTSTYSWRRGLAMGLSGGIVSTSIWIIRGQMWEIVWAMILLSGGFMIICQVREKRFSPANMTALALLIMLTARSPELVRLAASQVLPQQQRVVHQAAEAPVTPGIISAPPKQRSVAQKAAEAGWIAKLVARVAAIREACITFDPIAKLVARVAATREACITFDPKAGLNIDVDVHFHSLADLIRYLPRALLIGLFAPFPEMWIKTGVNSGLGARLLSGAETATMYLIELLALVGLWQKRRSLSVWLLPLISATGLIALGLVVVNVGALYRMRYMFWMLLIILGAEGLSYCYSRLPATARGRAGEGGLRASGLTGKVLQADRAGGGE